MINRECFGIFSLVTAFCRNANSIGLAGSACLLAIVLLIPGLPATALAQTQLGADINGEAASDYSGWSISLSSDGNRLAIGAEWNDGNGVDSGHVRVYQWSSIAWEQVGADIDGESAGDYSGKAISLSADGNRLAIGAPNNGDNLTYSSQVQAGRGDSGKLHSTPNNAGHVRVYQWLDSAWAQLGSDIDGEAEGDRSGHSVSLSSDGNRLAIGAPNNDGNGMTSGHVRVYHWSGTAWAQLGEDINGESVHDASGASVSLSSDGNRLAIGAEWNDGNGVDSGHVRVYEWSSIAWEQVGADIDGESAGDYSGGSVSLSSDGNRLAIGASGNDDNGMGSGHVRVYQWTDPAWAQLGVDIDGEAAGDNSGSVSLSSDGNRLAIGAPSNDGNGEESGHVRVYHWSGTAWVQIGADIDGEAAGDVSATVSLSSDGNRLAIGAPEIGGNGDGSGHVRVFDLSEFNVFQINPGLNDHWYNPATVGQGVYITVWPDLGKVTLTMFTYDTVLPPAEATANLGDSSQRWLNALGRYAGNEAVLNVSYDFDGIFDSPTETSKVRGYGTIILTFDSCSSGTLEYDIPSLGLTGIIPIQRIVGDNIALCEAFNSY